MTKLERLGNKCTNTICHKECPIYYFRKNGVEDIKKANWYLTRFLMLEELKNGCKGTDGGGQ